MAIQKAVSVGTGATLLTAVNNTRTRLAIFNNGSAAIFIGDATVTTANGFPVPAGQSFSVSANDMGPADLLFGGAWYAIVAASTNDVRVLEL